jgi:hypothetical protein
MSKSSKESELLELAHAWMDKYLSLPFYRFRAKNVAYKNMVAVGLELEKLGCQNRVVQLIQELRLAGRKL